MHCARKTKRANVAPVGSLKNFIITYRVQLLTNEKKKKRISLYPFRLYNQMHM